MRPRTFTDDELMAVARKCFLKHGPGVTTSVIAAELGVSQAALFKRIGTKRELLLRSLAPPTKGEWFEIVEQGPDDRPVAVQLRELVGRIDQFFTQLLPCMAVLGAADIDPREMFKYYAEPPPVRAHRAVAAWFQALHDRGLARVPSPLAATTALLGALQGRHLLAQLLGSAAPKTAPDYLDQLVAVLCNGIAVGEPK